MVGEWFVLLAPRVYCPTILIYLTEIIQGALSQKNLLGTFLRRLPPQTLPAAFPLNRIQSPLMRL